MYDGPVREGERTFLVLWIHALVYAETAVQELEEVLETSGERSCSNVHLPRLTWPQLVCRERRQA